MTNSSFTAASGRQYEIRDLQPTDAELLVKLFYQLSPETLYKRFHTVLDPENMPIEQVRKLVHPLAHVDSKQAVALIAIHDEHAVAVARFHLTPSGTDAESAIVVRDDHQKDGLGTQLLILLRERALQMGITHLFAMVQAQNHPIIKVIRRSGLDAKWRHEQGETYLAVDIRSPLPESPSHTLSTAKRSNTPLA